MQQPLNLGIHIPSSQGSNLSELEVADKVVVLLIINAT